MRSCRDSANAEFEVGEVQEDDETNRKSPMSAQLMGHWELTMYVPEVSVC